MIINKKYYDTLIIYPELEILKKNINIIMDELNEFISSNDKWIKWSKLLDMNKDIEWDTIPLYGYKKYTKYKIFFKKTIELLEQIKNIELISFSKLKPGVLLDIHHGPKFSNDKLRTQLGLIVPENCGMWVEGYKEFMSHGKFITFDDTKYHTAFNYSNEDRIILIIDLIRPEYLEKGNSTKELPKNYKKFIDDC